MAQGVVKSYDPNSGSGIVLLDTDKTEVYIQPGSLKDSIFRILRQGQRINFEIENIENSQVIKNVKIGQGDY
jgi:CspA family cold shock protein